MSNDRLSVPPLPPLLYRPTAERPVRAKLRELAADMQIEPHRHPWAQVALSSKGVIRMTAQDSTFLVPPMRALWIPPDIEHAVTVVEAAEIRTVYVHQDADHVGPARVPDDSPTWRQCRVLEVSRLLREMVPLLPTEPDTSPAPDVAADAAAPPSERERCLSMLVLDELARARPVRLGVDLPRDKRLRSLCEAVLDAPARWSALDDWARHVGASPRTVARLFRSELDTTFVQWRQQVLLARALSMAARKLPMGVIASELGYASASAFSAMVTRSVGMPPSRFLA